MFSECLPNTKNFLSSGPNSLRKGLLILITKDAVCRKFGDIEEAVDIEWT